MANLIEALKETNRWWSGQLELDYKDREIYPDLRRFLPERQIIALTGLRRVGKTTLMLRLAKEWAGPRENVVYFSFDDFRDVRIADVLKAYSELMGKDLDEGAYLILLDELQKVRGWEEQVKRIYDNRRNFKIIISGSESLFIRKGSRESLAGRFFEFRVGQLSFREFLGFRGAEVKNMRLQEAELAALFRRYLLTNGFPELIDSDVQVIRKYLKEGIIQKAVYRDIPQIMPVGEPAIMESILNIIMKDPGQMLNMEELAGEMGISRQTVSLYLDYLEKSYLIRKLYNFSASARKTERKLKKYYPAIISPDLIEKSEWGKVIETAAVVSSGAEFFWRDAYKREVDIVLAGKELLPIEVKSGKAETKNLLFFMEKFKAGRGFVLTTEEEDNIVSSGRKITVVPLWKWLLQSQSSKKD